jgi:hypothetical protein
MEKDDEFDLFDNPPDWIDEYEPELPDSDAPVNWDEFDDDEDEQF